MLRLSCIQRQAHVYNQGCIRFFHPSQEKAAEQMAEDMLEKASVGARGKPQRKHGSKLLMHGEDSGTRKLRTKRVPGHSTPIDLKSNTSNREKRRSYKTHTDRKRSLVFDGAWNTTEELKINSDYSTYEKLSLPNSSELPELEHKLSRVLFSPGVHYLQDPRSNVYNFDPYLSELLPVDQFDFGAITGFVSSSKDKKLAAVAAENNAKYYGSTSSMTGVLSHMHYMLSNFRPQSLRQLPKHYSCRANAFTKGAKLPASVIVRRNGSIYSIDSDKSTDREMILSLMGQSLERMLTQTPEEFEKFRIDSKTGQSKIQSENVESVYHYAKLSNFIMRSQLDCKDDRLPGTGTFDLKTRAASAVRFDMAKVERDSTGYQILKTYGKYESFEREQLDLARSTLLKYGLQARIGDMDGIFIAYHNTVKMFGFEYVPLSKIDEVMHSFGLPDFENPKVMNRKSKQKSSGDDSEIFDLKSELSSKLANDEFKLSVSLWDKILKFLTETELPNSSFRFITRAVPISLFETKLEVVATPITENEIKRLQSVGKDLRARVLKAANNVEVVHEILEEHCKSIEILNKELRRSPISFDVLVKNYIDGQESFNKHPIYHTLQSTWELQIKIIKRSTISAIKLYDELLKQRVDMLSKNGRILEDEEVSSFVKILRTYGERGRRLIKYQKSPVVWNKE